MTFTSHRSRGAIGTFFIAIAMVVGLVGCDNQGGGDSAKLTISMQQTDIESGDPTTWNIVQQFKKDNPDIDVQLSGQPVAQHDQSIAVAAQSNTLPSVFWVHDATTLAKLAKTGALADLGPILDDAGVTTIKEDVLKNFQVDGTQYGVPYQGLITGFYVNKKILQDNGLQMPVTFDDLLSMSTVLAAKGITPIASGANQSSFSVWAFLTCLDRYGYDSRIDGILAGTDKFDNPDFLRFYQSLQRLQQAGGFASNVSTLTYDQAVAEYTDGKAAMLNSGVWASSQIQKSAVGADTDFWVGPTFADGVGDQNIVMNVVGAPLAVSGAIKKGTAAYDAVVKFLQFYFSSSGQQVFADNGQPPVTSYEPTVPDSSSVFQSVLDSTKGRASPRAQPDQYLSSAVQNALYDSIYGVIQGQLTPQAAVDMVQQALEAAK